MINIDCVSKMSGTVCVLCLCLIISIGESIEPEPIHSVIGPKQDSSSSSELQQEKYVSQPILVGEKPKIEFPKKTDVSTPILIGDDPKKSNLPPKIFPVKQDKESSGPAIVSGADASNTEMNHNKAEGKVNLTNDNVSEKVNTTLPEIVTRKESPTEGSARAVLGQVNAELEDMLHSKYKGGQDVDELRPAKKASEVDEKKPAVPKKDPKSEVSVSPFMDQKGPKFMNETKTKSGESMLESTSKMMAVSSSVLANTQPKQHGITVVSVVLTVVGLLCFGAIGLLVWKRIAMRRSGRDVLINEEDFDEVADMHTFDRAQIQIT